MKIDFRIREGTINVLQVYCFSIANLIFHGLVTSLSEVTSSSFSKFESF